MRIDRFDYTVWIICLLLAAAIAGLIWGGNQRGVTVLTTTPPDGGRVGVRGPLVIRFPQAIDPDSIQGLFSIKPDISGELIVQGDQLVFFPDQAFIPDERYTASLRAGTVVQDGR